MALNINGTTGISGVDGSASAPAVTGTDSNTGINFGSDTVNINTGGSTRATVNSNGNLGIGNTDPSQARAVIQSASGTQLAIVKDNNGAALSLGGVTQPRILMEANPTSSQLAIYTAGGSTYASPSWTERMRISSDGRIYVGRTGNITMAGDQTDHTFEQIISNQYAIGIHCAQQYQRGIGIYYTTGQDAKDAFRFTIGTSTKVIIRNDGDLENTNNSYGSISDVSLKENIVDANSQWNDIKNIKIRNYNFKESTGHDTHTQIGVVAQELETICPKLVSADEDGIKSVSYSVLYMKAIKALQEAQARIETLETEKTQMQTDLTAITARVTALEAG